MNVRHSDKPPVPIRAGGMFALAARSSRHFLTGSRSTNHCRITRFGSSIRERFYCLDPETGAATQGECVEEVIANLREAMGLYLEEFPLVVPGLAPG